MSACERRPRAIALALILSAIGCGEEPPPRAPLVRPVRTVTIGTSSGERVRQFTGVTRAGAESTLSFKVVGTIRELPVRVGLQVAQGDLIAAIDPADYQLRVQQASESLRKAEAEARRAAANHERTRLLYENDNATIAELDAARAAEESTAAAVGGDAKGLELARLQLSYTELRAPVAGAIARVDVEVNENVSAGQAVAMLTSGNRPEVEVSVPGALITRIATGQEVSVSLDAFPGRSFAATVTEVGVASVGMQTTFPVTVRLDAETPQIRPGMAAEVAFIFRTAATNDELVRAPTWSVGEDREGNFVWIVEPAGDGTATVRRRAITVGEVVGDHIEVRAGLAPGDRVVTAGVSQITEGMTVRVQVQSP